MLLPQIPINAQQLDPTHKRTIGSYVLGKTLGQGTFGKVKAATHVPTNQKVAVKILEKDKIIDVADVERVSREIHILKLIRHPSIIQLYQIIQTPKQLFLIMEYMEGGQLFDYIVKSKKIPQTQACIIFQQIINGIQYLHKLNVVHRDLKPENLLIDYDNSIRLVDFGLSNTYRKQERLKTACGSPCYAAPEMIQSKNKYEPIMVDIWSCGVILYAMICGCLPFQDPETSKLYQKILAGEYKIPSHLSPEAVDLFSKILNTNPQTRYKINDIRKHKWWSIGSSKKNSSFGIIVGYHRIPIDDYVLDAVASLGFQKDFVRKCIESNRHNQYTTAYYLLLKKYSRIGGTTTTYLNSKDFDYKLLEPVRRKINTFLNTTTNANEKRNSSKSSQKERERFQNKQRGKSQQRVSRIHYSSFYYSKDKKFKEKRILVSPSHEKKEFTNSLNTSKRKSKQLSNSYELMRAQLQNDKFKDTYGAPVFSKQRSTQKQKAKRRSLKKKGNELTQNNFNKTIEIYSNTKHRNYRKIGVDKGFNKNTATIDGQNSGGRSYRKLY